MAEEMQCLGVFRRSGFAGVRLGPRIQCSLNIPALKDEFNVLGPRQVVQPVLSQLLKLPVHDSGHLRFMQKEYQITAGNRLHKAMLIQKFNKTVFQNLKGHA